MHKFAAIYIALNLLVTPVLAQTSSHPDTAVFMNVMAVCGAGLSINIDADLQGSLGSVYTGEVTKGRATQNIVPELLKSMDLDPKVIPLYLDCVTKLLAAQ